jgi:uncharacterized protein
MATSGSRMIFVNLAVRDLERSKEFFGKLGFEYNAQFTDDKAACMVVSDKACVMLLAESYFKTFTKKEVCDTNTQTEGLFALSCESRAEVDELVRKALDAGGSLAGDPLDLGFMYGGRFYDLDGHHWEVMWMDQSAVQ